MYKHLACVYLNCKFNEFACLSENVVTCELAEFGVTYKRVHSVRYIWVVLWLLCCANQSPCIAYVIAINCCFVACSSFWEAIITLFQLFTLDQWYTIYNDIIRVIHPVFACTYFILWVLVGAFVFRNLLIGIMGGCIKLSCIMCIARAMSAWQVTGNLILLLTRKNGN